MLPNLDLAPLDLPPETEDARALASEIMAREVVPNTATWDTDHHLPIEVIRMLGGLGLLGVAIDEHYGGSGLGSTGLCAVVEEIAAADAGLAVAVAVHGGLLPSAIAAFGTDEQKSKTLPALATGECLGAYLVTEADAGSDVGAIRTTATASTDGYEITGAKTWITNGGFADLFVVVARTAPGSGGLTAFITRPDASVSRSQSIPKMGLRSSSTCEVFFEGHRVNSGGILGVEGQGMRVALATLDAGRITIAAQACGIARAALSVAVSYASERHAFGGPIARFQGVQFPIADVAAELDAARLLTFKAAELRDAARPYAAVATKAKLIASGVAVRAANVAVQTLGGYGYASEYPAERLYRDARVTQIYEGTDQIQRLVIARGLFGDRARESAN